MHERVDRVLAQALRELVGRIGQPRRPQAERVRVGRDDAHEPVVHELPCELAAVTGAGAERARVDLKAGTARHEVAGEPVVVRERARALGVGEQRAHAGVLEAPQAVLEHGSRDVGRSLDEQRAASREREARSAGREHVVEPAGMHLGAREHAGSPGRRSRSARTRAARSSGAASKRASTCGVVTTVVVPCAASASSRASVSPSVAGPVVDAGDDVRVHVDERPDMRTRRHGSTIDANRGGLEGWS